MKIRELFEGGDLEKSLAKDIKAKFAKMKSDAPKSRSKRSAPKDSHPDKSTIWKKGFADGKAGRMDPKASDAYGPRTSEYKDGYTAGSKMKESVSEMSAGSVAGVAMPIGTMQSRTEPVKKRKKKKAKR